MWGYVDRVLATVPALAARWAWVSPFTILDVPAGQVRLHMAVLEEIDRAERAARATSY